MEAVLVTLGDPHQITGGYLYHLRMMSWAGRYGMILRFLSFAEGNPAASAIEPNLLAYLINKKPDVVIIDSIVAARTALWFETSLPFPTVGSVHQVPGGTSGNRQQRDLDLEAYRKMDLLILASETLLPQFERAGISRERTRVVPPGRDVDGWGERSGAGEQKPFPVKKGRAASFLCVANWEPHKGILELLKAFERLPDKAAVLHLVGAQTGDPNYVEQVNRRLAGPRLSGRVIVHGPVAPEAVGDFYREADVFVVPSSQDAYATAVGEAMAIGLPVIGWEAGNLPALADDGVEGRVIPEGDLNALATAMLELADDKDLRLRMGAAAKVRAAERPTWAESAAMFFGAIKEVAGVQSPAEDS